MIKIDLPNTLIITNNYFDRLNDVSAKINITILNEIIISLIETINNNKTIYTLGNGGSSSNASHFIIDLIKMGNSINKKIFLIIYLPLQQSQMIFLMMIFFHFNCHNLFQNTI